MGNTTIAGELIKELLTNFPNAYSRAIARMAVDKYPEVFTDEENTRAMVRYYRGAVGEKNRKWLADKKFIREFSKDLFNPFQLPEPDDSEYIPYVLPNDCNNILFLTDIHVPYHNIEALSLAIRHGVDNKIDTVFLGGDFLDFYRLSKYQKDPRKRDAAGELVIGKELLQRLRDIFPKARIYYLQGNHDLRLETYLMVKAPELFGISDFELNNLMRFGEMGIEYIRGKRIVKAGRLNILHGHEIVGGASSPVNIARGLYTKVKCSAICGHHHSTSEHTETSINGDIHTCWSVGHLGEENPSYMPINKWNLGFARIEVEKCGDFRVHNKRIKNGVIY